MLTRSLALELAPGIRVNGIAPGALLEPAGYEDAGLLTDLITRTPCTAWEALTASTRSLPFSSTINTLPGR